MFDYLETIPAPFWYCLLLWIVVNLAVLLTDRGWVLEELGLPAWKGRIPIYGAYLLYERTWKKEAFWLAFAGLGGRFFSWYLFIRFLAEGAFVFQDTTNWSGIFLFSLFAGECLFTLVGLAVHFTAMVHLAKAFDQGLLLALGLFLCPAMFMMSLVYARMETCEDPLDADETGSMACTLPDTELVYGDCIFTGTKEEIRVWLNRSALENEAGQTYHILSARCDGKAEVTEDECG